MPVTTAPAPTPTNLSGERNYYFDIYESNLNDTDIHPVTGLPAPGLHTRVVRLSTATDRRISLIFNRPGSASITLPLASSDVLKVVGYEVVRCVIVYCDDGNGVSKPVWSGYIGNVSLSSASQSVNVNFVGWMDLLYHRELRQTCVFTNLDAGDIATRLLSTANNQIANSNTIDLTRGLGQLDSTTSLSVFYTLDSGYPAVDSSWHTSGTGSVRLKSTNKNDQSYCQLGAANMVDAKGGDVLQVTYDAFVYTNSTAFVPWIQINWNNGAGVQRISAPTGTGQKSISQTITVPAGATGGTIFLIIQTPSSGVMDVSFDNLVIANGAAAEDILLGTGDFEDASKLIFPTVSPGFSRSAGWSGSNAYSIYLNATTGATVYFSPALSYGAPNIADGSGIINPTYIPIQAGGRYQVKAALNLLATITGTMRMELNISFYDANKATLGGTYAILAQSSTAAGKSIVVANCVDPTPENAVYAIISLNARFYSGGSFNGYVDAISIANTSVGLRKTSIDVGTVDSPASPVSRTRSYQPGQKIGQAIEELSNIESGFDWEVALVNTPIYQQLQNLIGFTMETNATYINGSGQWRNDVNGPITVASTIARSNAQAYSSVSSLAVTTTGAAGNKGTWFDMGGTGSSGAPYSASAWVYVTTAQNITASLQGTGVGSVTNTVAVPANTWTRITVTGWIPTGAGFSAGFYIYTSQTAAQTFYVDYANITQSALPYDFESTFGNGPQTGTTLTRKMNVRYTTVKAGTTIKGIGSDKTNVVFGMNADPQNLKDIGETRDVSKLSNRINGRRGNQSAMAQNMASINKYNLWEDSLTISDTGANDVNVLLAYAGGELVFRSAPTKIWAPAPIPWDGTPTKPRFWVDYNLGDIVYLVVNDGALQIGNTTARQPIRLFGATVRIDNEGNEFIESLQTTASA